MNKENNFFNGKQITPMGGNWLSKKEICDISNMSTIYLESDATLYRDDDNMKAIAIFANSDRKFDSYDLNLIKIAINRSKPNLKYEVYGINENNSLSIVFIDVNLKDYDFISELASIVNFIQNRLIKHDNRFAIIYKAAKSIINSIDLPDNDLGKYIFCDKKYTDIVIKLLEKNYDTIWAADFKETIGEFDFDYVVTLRKFNGNYQAVFIGKDIFVLLDNQHCGLTKFESIDNIPDCKEEYNE